MSRRENKHRKSVQMLERFHAMHDGKLPTLSTAERLLQTSHERVKQMVKDLAQKRKYQLSTIICIPIGYIYHTKYNI